MRFQLGVMLTLLPVWSCIVGYHYCQYSIGSALICFGILVGVTVTQWLGAGLILTEIKRCGEDPAEVGRIMTRFSIRDLMWLTVVVALLCSAITYRARADNAEQATRAQHLMDEYGSNYVAAIDLKTKGYDHFRGEAVVDERNIGYAPRDYLEFLTNGCIKRHNPAGKWVASYAFNEQRVSRVDVTDEEVIIFYREPPQFMPTSQPPPPPPPEVD